MTESVSFYIGIDSTGGDPRKQELFCSATQRHRALLAISTPTLADSAAFPEASSREHIEVLLSDAFEGRTAGTEGEKKTLTHIERPFPVVGLQLGIGGSVLRPVPMSGVLEFDADRWCIQGAPGAELTAPAYSYAVTFPSYD